MLTYDLKVGYSCNNKCKHCVIDDSKDKLIEQRKNIDLTTEECMEQIDAALKKGIDHIVLTGGEVTIRKDFPELIKKCTDHDLAITIQTNGRNLGDERIINAVKDVIKIRFVIALHGKEAEVHDSITQVLGSFEQTCNGVKAMCNLGKLVILKVVISKINAPDLSGIVELAASLGVNYICFAFPHGQGAARKNFGEVMPTYSYLKPYLDQLIRIGKKNCINIEFEAIPFCIIPQAMQLVGELKYFDGDTICTQVKEDTFQWDEVRKSIKSKGENCAKCDMNEFCEGPWCEYVDTFGTDELKPIVFPEEHRDKIIEKIKEYLK
ncbi:radical SAM protein [Clostridiaceae bacterium]|nr:radical SAM protein [Clostridiaceae bacterium]